ncbi:MAG: hypothetical protein K6T66_01180 [Peptococcaceae bacterium]|nr:hypothetical protein [Peptococcaceae bacterium]
MLEKGYTIPVLFGICLGLVLTGVQVSVTALNAALEKPDLAVAVVENAGPNGLDMRVLGKRVSIRFPGRPEEMAAAAAEKAGILCGRLREKAVRACGELRNLPELGEKALSFYRGRKE